MTYPNQYGLGGPPFWNENMSQDESRGQDELSMTVSWYGSQIDQSLAHMDPSMLGLQLNNHRGPHMAFQVQQDLHLQTQEYNHQQAPMNRFFNESRKESQLPLFNAAPSQGSQVFSHGLNQPGAPIQSLPQTGYMRHASPSLSQGLSSTCASAQSPNTDPDWNYYTQAHEEYAMPNGMEYYANSPPQYPNSPPDFEGAQVRYQHYTLPQQAVGSSCVNMSQVQGFADPQEVTFETDEGYDELNLKSEYMDPDNKQEIKLESGRHQDFQDYHSYHTDSAVGSSIKDINSPENTSIHVHGDSEIDAEGEVDAEQDQDIEVEIEEASDTEYKPRNTRTRKRPSTSSIKPTPKKSTSNRVSKSKSSSASTNGNSKLTCKSCDAPPFKDVLTLSRHVASSHTRAFVCVFSFAGCPSTFASKNEWKRHVSSQHLNLTAWVCDLGSCGTSKNGGHGGAEFNRKDLFTQHLRRMHAPHSVKRKKLTDEHWEREVKDLQVSAIIEKRSPPVKLRCPIANCGLLFEGQGCWDERMEHVGKHLERAGSNFGSGSGERDGNGEVDQGRDALLVAWALREGIVEERRVGGGGAGYRLIVGGGKRGGGDGDEDAEGEVE